MSERSAKRNELVNRMLELQKKFIAHEHDGGVDMSNYYNSPKGHVLEGYQAQYNELSRELVDLAHSEVGSRR